MNLIYLLDFWGVYFLSVNNGVRLETGFVEVLSSLELGDVKSEFLLPTIMDGLIHSRKAKVKLLETNDKWLGLTYKEKLFA